ncbi:MAG: hypothetical protein OJF60_002914 [Burkholderiaceae bacterium]|nr:MAG: hypothetical protein OJF60_002914 [Burkholderiaceae bacterium]
MNHPQAARTACRFANPLRGGTLSGPAKPAPRVSPHGLLRGLLHLCSLCAADEATHRGE